MTFTKERVNKVLKKYLKIHRTTINVNSKELYPITDHFGTLVSYYGLSDEEPMFCMPVEDCVTGLVKAKELERYYGGYTDTNGKWSSQEYVKISLGSSGKATLDVTAKYWDAQPRKGVCNEY